MRIKIFFVLLLCALHQTDGSKSTKKKGDSRLIKWAKKCLIAVAVNYGANEVVNTEKHKVADSISLACKYNIPDRNAGVMMKFVTCAKDQEFEKYMFDNSENCPKIKDLYNQAKSDGNCALNTPKIIPNRALAIFRGEQLSHATNGGMFKEYLLSYPGEYGAFSESDELYDRFVSQIYMHKSDFDFFQFTSMLEVTKIAYPNDREMAVLMALRTELQDVNAEHAKKLLELTRLAYPNNTGMAVVMALDSEYKDVNVKHTKRVLELTKFVYPDDTNVDKLMAVSMALRDEFKDVNVDNAKRLLEVTKLAYPNDTEQAVVMALINECNYKDFNVEHAERVFELTKLAFPDLDVAVREVLKPKYKDVDVDKVNKKYQELKNFWLWHFSSEQRIMKEALKVTYPEVVKEDF